MSMIRTVIKKLRRRAGIVRHVKNLFSIIRRDHKRMLVGLLVLMCMQAVLNTAFVGSLPVAVQALQDPARAQEMTAFVYLQEWFDLPDMDVRMLAVSVVVVALLLTLVGGFGVTVVQSIVMRAFRNDLSERLFGAYILAPYVFHLRMNTALLVRNINNEVKKTAGSFFALLQLIMGGLTFSLMAAVLLINEPAISVFAVVANGAAGGAVLFLVRRTTKNLGARLRIQQGELIKIINQAMADIRSMRVLGRSAEVYDQFSCTLRGVTETNHKRRLLGGIIRPALFVTGLLTLGLVFAALYIREGSLGPTLPTMALFAGAAHRMLPAVTKSVKGMMHLYFVSVSATAVAKDLYDLRGEEALDPIEFADTEGNLPFEEAIRVRGLTFSYPDADSPALDGVSLDIEKGEMIGLVGSTGSGKSTAVDAIIGILEPHKGSVTLDGVDIHHDIDDWQGLLGVVPQSIYLIDDTIRNNVAFGVPLANIDDQAVWDALEHAHLASTVREIDGQLDAMVGENGVNLSGGERQRLGLARAIYRDPEILILDEATSSLDNRTERAVMNELLAMRESRTIVLVAHRLTTVKDCDRIYVFKDGEIVSTGTYEELIRDSRQFREIADVE